MNKQYAYLAYLCLFFVLPFISSCKKGDGGSSGGSPGNSTGSLSTGSTGLSNVWMSEFTTANGKEDTTYTELTLASDHSVSRVITISLLQGFSTYTTLLTVYSGGKLTQLLSAADSTATTGTLNTAFDYSASGQLQRIRYNPNTSGYTYDSLVLSSDNILQSVYHFTPVGASGTLTEVQSETYTWSSQHDIIAVLFNDYDTTADTWSASTVQYQYDGSYNPYQTVKDLPLILGGINTVNLLSANNVTGITLVGLTIGVNYIYTYNSQSLPTISDDQVIEQTELKNSVFTYFQYIE
jgi:hypothetical protein